MRTVAVVTVSRSDYGIWRPILSRIKASRGLKLFLIASGTHLSPQFGKTEREIRADGFHIAARVAALGGDTPRAIARAMSRALSGFARVFSARRPDLLLLLGDRFEMHAAALAALPFNIPVGHIHGGELTWGAFDDALRHSITKLSHLHFVSAPGYARRVRQLGEEGRRIIVCGAPALDNLRSTPLLTAAQLSDKFGLTLSSARPVLATFHPVTLEPGQARRQMTALLQALKACGRCVIFTMPNADTDNRVIRALIRKFVASNPRAQAVENLGTQGYFSLMARAGAMAGNSSSALIEAPSFALPAVNIGGRQGGRLRAANVIDAKPEKNSILAALRRALSPKFRASLKGLRNPYGYGDAAGIIVKHIRGVDLEGITLKHFADLPARKHG